MITEERLDDIAERLYEARRKAVEQDDYSLNGDDHTLANTEKRIVDELTEHEFTLVGYGMARIVFRDGDSVVKFARFGRGDTILDGKQQNQFELDIVDATDCSVLNQPQSTGKDALWVEYPFVTPLPETDLSEMRRKKALMHVNRELEDVPQINAVELSPDNIGYDGENLYVIDFGVPTPEDLQEK